MSTLFPGERYSTRPLHLVWVLDCSASMRGERITSVNFAIKESIPALQALAAENPQVEVLVQAIGFSTGARWHIGVPTPVEVLTWPDLAAGGRADMGAALSLLAEELGKRPLPERALPPVVVLVSSAPPTDDFETGLSRLLGEPWGRRAMKIGVYIGEHADRQALQRFIGDPQRRPLQASNMESFVDMVTPLLRWEGVPTIPPAPRAEATEADVGFTPRVDSASDDDVW